jgi:hypothetical protein
MISRTSLPYSSRIVEGFLIPKGFQGVVFLALKDL